jgi:HSP20 family protein
MFESDTASPFLADVFRTPCDDGRAVQCPSNPPYRGKRCSMKKTKAVKVQREKESFKKRFSEFLDEMWEKIGQHHHALAGRVPGDVAADLSDTKDAFNYTLDLPGMDETNVEVLVESGRLIVRGEKQDERKEKGQNYVFRERRFGSFERSFALPANAREKDITATFKNGVLTVSIPYKAEKEKAPRKITIASD